MRPPYPAQRWLTDLAAVRDQWRVVLAAAALSALAGWLAPIVLVEADHTAYASVWTGGPGVTAGIIAGTVGGADGTLVHLMESRRSVDRIADRADMTTTEVRRDLHVQGYTVVTITAHSNGAARTSRLLKAALAEAVDVGDATSAAAVASRADGAPPQMVDSPTTPVSDRGLVPSIKQAARGAGVGLLLVVPMVVGLALLEDHVRSRRDLRAVLASAGEPPPRRTPA